MALLRDDLLTLADVKKFLPATISDVTEVLRKAIPIIDDIPYQEMNKGVKHVVFLRSDLPEVYYRKANQAIPPSKTTIEEREFVAAHFESKAQMDEAVAAYGGKDRIGVNRWNQAEGHLQANANELGSLILYGSDEINKVPGIGDILSTLNPAEPTSKQIVDAGGTGSDNTSIYFVSWGKGKVYGVYEAGTTAGIQRIDRSPGNTRVQITGPLVGGGTGTYWGYEEDFMVDHGLVVEDYRALARVANIDVSNLLVDTDAADLLKLMTRALYRIPPQLRQQKGKIYVNSTVMSFLDEQALAKVGAGGGLSYKDYQGEPVLYFRGWQLREMDIILNTEARVTT